MSDRAAREARYAGVILANFHGPDDKHSTWWLNTKEIGAAVMALADREQAELTATVARVEALADEFDLPRERGGGDYGPHYAEKLRAALRGEPS